jgi:hypothetical protein
MSGCSTPLPAGLMPRLSVMTPIRRFRVDVAAGAAQVEGIAEQSRVTARHGTARFGAPSPEP